ncbi:MAG: CHAT domain-containing protein [Magnetococcales bacterium]|nr:CHAT domain-containing protein [Magnetococcales bacterium]
MSIKIRLEDDTLYNDPIDNRRELEADHLTELDGLIQRYAKVLETEDRAELLAIGQALFQWLDGGQDWLVNGIKGTGAIKLSLTVSIEEMERNEETPNSARLMIGAPWELLALPEGRFVVEDHRRLFLVERWLGDQETSYQAENRDLRLMFMAAAPDGVSELDFEQEETSILNATGTLPLQLLVEESGNLFNLSERVRLDGPIEALHLSCHGGFDEGTPVLALENDFGDQEDVSVANLINALGEKPPPMVFLSACHSAASRAAVGSLATDLIISGVGNVMGWDGPVLDWDASQFAKQFYSDLAGFSTVAHAAAKARQVLYQKWIKDSEHNLGRHWHLARLYLGGTGGSTVTIQNGHQRSTTGHEIGYQEYLDLEKKVPVAPRNLFVGRRRILQRILRTLSEGKGALVHGMGNQGKSSVAARIANRLPKHKPVVIYGSYDAQAIFSAVIKALKPKDRASKKRDWLASIKDDPTLLADALEDLLDTLQAEYNPILLILDDLEQILDPLPASGDFTTVKNRYKKPLSAVLSALHTSRTDSRLLLTSRYTFTLPDNTNRDLAAKTLTTIALPPMGLVEQYKQQQTELHHHINRADIQLDPEWFHEIGPLLNRCVDISQGNPGLQNLLSNAILNKEIKAAKKAIKAVEEYLKKGQTTTEGDAGDFFKRMALDQFRATLPAHITQAFRAMMLFGLPIPKLVAEKVCADFKVDQPAKALTRLTGLGLIDRYDTDKQSEPAELITNPLARHLFEDPSDEEATLLAQSAAPLLYSAWLDSDGNLPWSTQSVALYQLANLASNCPEILTKAARYGGWHLWKKLKHPEKPLEMAQTALEKLSGEQINSDLETNLMQLIVSCANQSSWDSELEKIIAKKIDNNKHPSYEIAKLWNVWSERLRTLGDYDGALKWLEKSKEVFQKKEDPRHLAITWRKIADILVIRGELDRALRIRKVEEFPVFERLQDVRERAITLGRIADILTYRGELDEALRIRKVELLPVYERLQDVREHAITWGKISNILATRGELDEALRILKVELLPVFEHLGDVSSRATTWGEIADILATRGELDEALRILKVEQLPVYERLRDVLSRAIIWGNIAQIRQQQGDLDEALRIHQEECIPLYESLQNKEGLIRCWYYISDIRLEKGVENPKAIMSIIDDLRKAFASAWKLGNANFISVIGWRLGNLLAQFGWKNEAVEFLKASCEAYRIMGLTENVEVTEKRIQEILSEGD